MFDCGIHPGFSGVTSLPYLDGNEDIDISKVDVALITHFHLDHCAAVPYLLSKTRFKVSELQLPHACNHIHVHKHICALQATC